MAIVTVHGIPDWLDHKRLLDDGQWDVNDGVLIGERTLPQATLIAERLRNQGLNGAPIVVDISPPPRRSLVRKARTEVARLRRGGESGFKHPGTKVDDDGRAFLTSERLAMSLARRARASTLVDATCGCGGNAIAFARLGIEVTAIEINPARLALARHNARVYGVSDRITFVEGDALEVLPNLDADLIFADPPWGEVDRVWCRSLPLLDGLLRATATASRVWLKVPPSFAPPPQGFRVEPWFGMGKGDRQVVKFLLLRRDRAL